MDLFDTHCHIHEIASEGEVAAKWRKAGVTDPDAVIARARAAGVNKLICVGCTLHYSQLAVSFVKLREGCYASVGIHPHEAKDYADAPEKLAQFAALATRPKVVAVGECGLDYYYNHSPKAAQAKVLRFQIELALKHNLPMIFHVRDAFDDFWPIFDSYPGIKGVIHSFSAGPAELQQILQRNLYVGLNGIMTFSKNPSQLAAAKAVPLDKLLLETDAPFLTPVPERGTICEPKHVCLVADFLAHCKDESLRDIARESTKNAQALFHV